METVNEVVTIQIKLRSPNRFAYNFIHYYLEVCITQDSTTIVGSQILTLQATKYFTVPQNNTINTTNSVLTTIAHDNVHHS